MKISKAFWFCLVLTIFANALQAAEEAASQETQSIKKEDVVKDRQHFNKLKRSTRNIYKVTMRSTVAYRLQTALGYISTIDLPDPALKVFTGDQELFKIEVYEKQVLIKPITDEPDARTNLVIVTHSGRLTFDVSVGAPETADFVLDFRLPEDDESIVQNAFQEKVEASRKELETQYQAKEEALDQKAQALSDEKLKAEIASGVKTLELKKSEKSGEIQLNLLSLSQMGNKLYLRFSILNYSKTPYRVRSAFLGIQTYDKKLIGKKESGLIEIPAELKVPPAINPDKYEYGVLVFEYRSLGKLETPVFRVMEDTFSDKRDIEIKGFEWFK